MMIAISVHSRALLPGNNPQCSTFNVSPRLIESFHRCTLSTQGLQELLAQSSLWDAAFRNPLTLLYAFQLFLCLVLQLCSQWKRPLYHK